MSSLKEERTLPNANPDVLIAEGCDTRKDGEQGNGPRKPRREASCRRRDCWDLNELAVSQQETPRKLSGTGQRL
jgi:hypothetical protein